MPDIKTLLEDEDKKTSGVVASGEKKVSEFNNSVAS
jgi:hypothetical protein